MHITKYSKHSGQILGYLIMQDVQGAIAEYTTADFGCLEGKIDPATSWINNGVEAARTAVTLTPSLTVAPIGGTITVSGIPEGAWVSVNSADATQITGGSLTISQPTVSGATVETVGQYQSGHLFLRFADLTPEKDRAKAAIDLAAEAARGAHITEGSGQAMTYLRKAEAARVLLAGGTMSASQTARINDEAARLGITAEQAAQQLVAIADGWEMIDAKIDNLRLTTKQQIDAATTPQDIATIVAGVVWPA